MHGHCKGVEGELHGLPVPFLLTSALDTSRDDTAGPWGWGRNVQPEAHCSPVPTTLAHSRCTIKKCVWGNGCS